jgi:hypothetical protein
MTSRDVARDGTQYEPDVYQPSGQVPDLTTGLWRPTTVESASANMNGCQDYYNSILWCGGFQGLLVNLYAFQVGVLG